MTVIINGTTGITNVNGSAAAPAETGTDTDTGIVYGTNTLSLSTGGVAAVTIDSSQNLTIPQATAAGSNSVSLPPYLSLTGFGWNTSLGSSPIGGRIALTGTYSSPTFGQVSPSLSFSTQDSNGSMTQRAQINAFGIGLGNGTVPSSGTGIAFPATQSASTDANTLDDYEEGTFTPTYTGSGTNPTVTYLSDTYGKYTKIGNAVIFSLEVRTSAISGGSGDLRISGLPFTAASIPYPECAVTFYQITLDAGFVYTGEIQASNTFLILRGYASASTSANLTPSAVKSVNPALIRVTGTYFV